MFEWGGFGKLDTEGKWGGSLQGNASAKVRAKAWCVCEGDRDVASQGRTEKRQEIWVLLQTSSSKALLCFCFLSTAVILHVAPPSDMLLLHYKLL